MSNVNLTDDSASQSQSNASDFPAANKNDFGPTQSPDPAHAGWYSMEGPAPLREVEAIRGRYAPDKKPLATFTGTGEELFGIMAVNFFFTILTLGIYHFWGKVRVRKYLWKHTRILGSPLEYTGNGLELLQSFLIVVAALALFSLAADFSAILAAFLSLGLLWTIFFAMYRSIRFRLTRTRWRGIYANLSGSAVDFANMATLLSIGNICCLGLLTPTIYAQLCGTVSNNIWWGNTQLSFGGKAGQLYKPFLISICMGFMCTLLLAFLSAAMLPRQMGYIFGYIPIGAFISYLLFLMVVIACFSYYAGAKLHWLLKNFSLPGAKFHSGLPEMTLITLCLTNILLSAFTLGLGYAWVAARTCRHLAVAAVYEGEINADTLQQNTQAIPARGDGLLDVLDLDVAF